MAARRREARTPDKKKARGAPKGGGSSVARLFKLGLLVGAFVCIGFFVVLVIDVGAGLIGSMKLGDTTISSVWDKVVARVLDDDVPRVEPSKARAVAPRPAPRPEAARAPVKVASPEEDARHVDVRPDPEVARAKARLDEILGRL